MKSVSLHRQLMLWLLIPLLSLWVFGGVIAYIIAVRFADLAHDRSLFDSTLTLSEQVRAVHGRVILDLPEPALKMLEIDPYDKVYFKVSSRYQGWVAGMNGLSPPPAGMNIPFNSPYYHDDILDGHHVRISSLYLHVPGNRQDWILVQVAETLVKRRVLADEILAGVILPQMLLTGLAAGIVWIGITKGLSSLRRLQNEVQSRSHRDLSPLSEENAPREVGSLIRAINDLLNRLGNALAAQSRFIADAAHQLRTPLAGLKTQTDYALRQSNPDEIRHSLKQLQTSSERTIHLINQLLSLARAEPGWEKTILPAKIDLNTLASEVTSRWVPQALKKDIDLGFEPAPGPVILSGSDFLLQEMLGNLVDNAIRYTHPGGKVTVSLFRREGETGISVEDNGPAIPRSEQEHIFERFHRILGSQEEGCGLGLSIVREIAHAHNGEVFLVEQPVGKIFEVRFFVRMGHLDDEFIDQQKEKLVV
ncbi:MAG: sensor histidine kinase [Burkholderiales bacterium]|nr:sensor histidine kinase [Burkholderiales bacterium]